MTMADLLLPELLALPAALLLAIIAWLAQRLHVQRAEIARHARVHHEESVARHRAAARATWLEAALEMLEEGVLVADPDQRAIHWNQRFAALSGLPEDLPRDGATLASLLRHSAEAGEFGLVDVDQEVASQLALIARGPAAFPQLRHRPDGAVVEFRLQSMPDGGILIRCSDVTSRQRATPPAPVQGPATPRPKPAAAPPRDPVAAEPAPPHQPPPRPRRCVVLLVEDMKVNQMVTATQLRREGHRVDIASSGPEALLLAAGTPYDIVLMDLMMPGMSGYDTARRLRALPGLAGRVPIYALTANTGEEERARCLAAGMQGMLTKPLPATALREVLQGAASVPAAMPLPPAARSPPPSNPGLLNPARLEELRRDLPPATLATLCRQCLDDMDTRLQRLEAALAAGTPETIEQEAHALAGMAGSYALAMVETAARAVMAHARRADTAAARAAAADLPDAFARSRVALLAALAAD